jgi:FMN phosphatase YigB (HAD superfamily)
VIKTIIFDLGNTIVPFDFKRGYAKMAPLCGYPAAEIPKRIASTDLVPRFERGQVEPEPFVNELCRLLELRVSYGEFCDLWTSIFLPETLIPEALVTKLRARYRLLLLSNTNAIHFGMIEAQYPIVRRFDDLVLSYRVGALKPSEEIYRRAIAQARCRPEECFFTDDILPFVEAARKTGIDAVQFQSLEQLEADLRSRGIEWDEA